ncbi:MAG: nuclear transport factor 2 family protein, partial [Nocardioides sp.]
MSPGIDPSDDLRAAERARLRALVEPDLDVADALHADDYQLITPGGAVLSKQDYLGAVAAGELDYRTFEAVSDVAVRAGEHFGVVRYRA